MGSISSRRHSVERPPSRSASRWFGTIAPLRANQTADSPVSTRPLSGISVGRTTSKVEMRSLATSSSRSSSRAYSSRTLPLPTCRAVSGMNRFLLPVEGVQTVEDGVDVTDGRVTIEHVVEVDAAGELAVGPHELREVRFLLPRAHGVRLHSAVGLVARQPRLH